MADQTRASLAIIDANLAEVGSDKHHILEAVVYMTDIARKQGMDDVWCDWIPDGGWPNRACVGADLAPGTLVEIKLTALKAG
ncbi:MAG: Rid family hydrolase [Rhodospirillaceae bacterium]